MKKGFLLSFVLIFCLLLAPLADTSAQVPKIMNFQGSVTDQLGQPINNTVPIEFKIYESEYGGTPLWVEIQDVNAIEGFVNVYLGTINPLALDFNRQYWLELKVGNGTPFARTRLSSSPYSMYAVTADTAEWALNVAENGVQTFSIADGAVTQSKLAPGITAIPDGPAGGDLMGNYPNPTIDPAAITRNIGPGSITQDKLAPNVTTPPSGPAGGDLTGTYPDPLIAVGAVKTDRIYDRAVTETKIAMDAVTPYQLEETSVNAGLYGDMYNVGSFIVDEDGRLTFAENVLINADDQMASDIDVYGPEINNLDLQLKEEVVGPFELIPTAVMAGDYGDEYNVATFTVDEDGRLTAAADVLIMSMDDELASDIDVVVGDIDNFDYQLKADVVGVPELNAYTESDNTKPMDASSDGSFMYYAYDALNPEGLKWTGAAAHHTSPVWDATAGEFTWGVPDVNALHPIVGYGTADWPLHLDTSATFVNMYDVLYFDGMNWVAGLITPPNLATTNMANGTTDGHVLTWNDGEGMMEWDVPHAIVDTKYPIEGDGSEDDPIAIVDAGDYNILYYDGTAGQWDVGLVMTPSIADGAVTEGKIADGAVTSAKIFNETIIAEDIATGAVTTVEILNETILAEDIAMGAVTTDEILDGTIMTADLGDLQVTTAKIADDAVTSAKIANETIQAEDIAMGAVTTDEILDGTILTEDIALLQITTALIADDAVTSAKIANETIMAEDIGTGQVTTDEILDGTILTEDIDDLQITTAKIADDAVTSGKIANETIMAEDIGTGQVTTDEILDGTILGVDIDEDAVGPFQLAETLVTPGQYGSATEVPVLTVDEDGRLTEVYNEPIFIDDAATFGEGEVSVIDITNNTESDNLYLSFREGVVDSYAIEDGGVENDDLAADAVTSDKILDNEVNTDDITDQTIMPIDIAPGDEYTALITYGGAVEWGVPRGYAVDPIQGYGTEDFPYHIDTSAVFVEDMDVLYFDRTAGAWMAAHVSEEMSTAENEDLFSVLFYNGTDWEWTNAPTEDHSYLRYIDNGVDDPYLDWGAELIHFDDILSGINTDALMEVGDSAILRPALTDPGEIWANNWVTAAPFVADDITANLTLTVGDGAGAGTATIDYLDVLFDATVAGTFDVTGLTTLTDFDASGNGTVGGTFDVTGAATVGGTLDVTGLTTLTDFDATGNGTVGGTFDVTGLTTLTDFDATGNGTVGGTFDVTGLTTLTDFDATGNGTVGGTFDVTGAATVGGTLGVTGLATFDGGIDVNAVSTIDADITFNAANAVNLEGTTTTSGIFDINDGGGTAIFALSGVEGAANEIMIGQGPGATPIWSTDLVLTSLTVDDLTVNNNATVGGTLGVTGLTTLTDFDATGNGTVGGTFDVTGAATVGGTLGVTGLTTLTDFDATGNGTVGGTFGVTGLTTLTDFDATGNGTVGGTFDVTGAATVGGTLGVTGLTTLTDFDATGNGTVGGTFDVTGAATMGATLAVTGIVTHDGGVQVLDQDDVFAGDVTGVWNLLDIAADAVTTAEILDATIVTADVADAFEFAALTADAGAVSLTNVSHGLAIVGSGDVTTDITGNTLTIDADASVETDNYITGDGSLATPVEFDDVSFLGDAHTWLGNQTFSGTTTFNGTATIAAGATVDFQASIGNTAGNVTIDDDLQINDRAIFAGVLSTNDLLVLAADDISALVNWTGGNIASTDLPASGLVNGRILYIANNSGVGITVDGSAVADGEAIGFIYMAAWCKLVN